MFVLRAYTLFIPMRMNKSGNQSVPASANNQVINWVADGAYAGTVIDAHRLKVMGGDNKSIIAAMQWTGTNGWNKSAQLWKNGVQIGTTQSSTASSGTFSWNLTGQTLVEGDFLEIRATASSVGITVVATGTYLMVQDT